MMSFFAPGGTWSAALRTALPCTALLVPLSLPGPTSAEFSQTLTADRFAPRSSLAEDGVLIELFNTTDYFVNVEGGADEDATLSNLFEAAVTVDLESVAGIEGGTLFFLGIGTHGDDPGASTGTVHAPSNLAADEAWRILELWYEQSLLAGRLGLLFGVYAVDSEFDAKETADVFVNGGFGTGLDLSETGLNGPSIFPVTGLGLRLRADLGKGWSVLAAVADGVPGDPDDPTSGELSLGGDDGLLLIGEANYQPLAADFFRLGFGAWRYTTDFEDLVAIGPGGDPVIREGAEGVYAFVEGSLYSEPGTSDQGLSGFARAGWADDDVNQIARYYAAGLVYTGLLPTRDADVAGIGVSVGVNGDPFREARRAAGAPVTRSESLVELTYRAQATSWLGLQLVLQYTADPGTDPALDDSVLVGLRVGIDL